MQELLETYGEGALSIVRGPGMTDGRASAFDLDDRFNLAVPSADTVKRRKAFWPLTTGLRLPAFEIIYSAVIEIAGPEAGEGGAVSLPGDQSKKLDRRGDLRKIVIRVSNLPGELGIKALESLDILRQVCQPGPLRSRPEGGRSPGKAAEN